MKLAFCIFKYHPFGGLQRDFLRIAKACVTRGHSVTVFVSEWRGDQPDFLTVQLLKPHGASNHVKTQHFSELVRAQSKVFDCVIGFNRMPYLDVFFAGESCYEAGARKKKPWWFFWTKRYKTYKAMEEGVYGADSQTSALLLSPSEKALILQYYPKADSRLHFLPPGIEAGRMPLQHWGAIRNRLRESLQCKPFLLLMVGSNFKRKGVDRAIRALASLPEALKARTQLTIIGDGDSEKAAALAKQLGVLDGCNFLGTKDNAPEYLLAADILLHTAREETAGMVILEAIAAHLPMIVTGACGYAYLTESSGAGEVLAEPFEQSALNNTLEIMLHNDLSPYKKALASYTQSHDLFGLEAAVVDFIETQGRQ